MNANAPTISSDEARWIASHPEQADVCRWLVGYALAFNTLSIEPLKKTLSPWVTYESQSLSDKMEGPKLLYAYWKGKFQSIAKSESKVVAELSTLPSGLPGVTLYQAGSALDTNWLDKPLAVMTAEVNALGEATMLLMITCAPSPSSARGTRIFPGFDGTPTTNEKKFIRKSSDYSEICVYAFYLDGEISLDIEMKRSVAFAQESLRGLKVIEETYSGLGRSINQENLNKFHFVGFPSIGATFCGKPIYRQQGLISGERLVEALKTASPMFLATTSRASRQK